MQPSRSQISALSILTVFSHIHLGVRAQVQCNVTRTGGNADLTCKIPSDMDIVQVTWQKRTGNSYETLVTHSKRFGVKISKPYKNRLSVLPTKDPGTSVIALSQLEKEDDAHYTAIFNIYPNGALKGELYLPKLPEVREVVCKSPAGFSVTLDPPQILTQHSEPNGNIIQRGRWLDASISPVCNFQLQKEARTRRNDQDKEEELTIECKASGKQRPTVTWINEGQPKSIEEKMNKTGDVFTVSSTQRLLLSTLPKGERISCNISYNNDIELNSGKSKNTGLTGGKNKSIEFDIEQRKAERFDFYSKKNRELSIGRIMIVSTSLVLFFLVIFVMWYVKKTHPDSPKKDDKGEMGFVTPVKDHNSATNETPGSETKQRKNLGQKHGNSRRQLEL